MLHYLVTRVYYFAFNGCGIVSLHVSIILLSMDAALSRYTCLLFFFEWMLHCLVTRVYYFAFNGCGIVSLHVSIILLSMDAALSRYTCLLVCFQWMLHCLVTRVYYFAFNGCCIVSLHVSIMLLSMDAALSCISDWICNILLECLFVCYCFQMFNVKSSSLVTFRLQTYIYKCWCIYRNLDLHLKFFKHKKINCIAM